MSPSIPTRRTHLVTQERLLVLVKIDMTPSLLPPREQPFHLWLLDDLLLRFPGFDLELDDLFEGFDGFEEAAFALAFGVEPEVPLLEL